MDDGAGVAMDEAVEAGKRPNGAVVSRPANCAGDEIQCSHTSFDGAFVAAVVVGSAVVVAGN